MGSALTERKLRAVAEDLMLSAVGLRATAALGVAVGVPDVSDAIFAPTAPAPFGRRPPSIFIG